MLALVRLYATGGYCTPRHSLILAFPLIAAAAHGLVLLGDRLAARFAAGAADGFAHGFPRPAELATPLQGKSAKTEPTQTICCSGLAPQRGMAPGLVVTPAMIDAGISEYLSRDREDGYAAELVTDIFLAMLQAAPKCGRVE